LNAQTINKDDEARLVGGPFQIEIRGYEVARWDGAGWTQVGAYRANEIGRGQALASARWLNERHPGAYKMRPLISVDLDFLPQMPVPEVAEATTAED
jgi:hypothetical protein